MRRIAAQGRRTLYTLRWIGPHPRLLTAHLLHRARERRRIARLRASYDATVGAAAPSASLRLPDIQIPPGNELPDALEAAARRVRSEADAILRHEVAFLGSGPVELGDRIDWHVDFKSGVGWPVDFYMDLRVTNPDDASDAKVPWELSRGHHLLTLARAARLYGNPRYVEELHSQLAGWLDDNPPGRGINWANPMEVAVRAINWLWALGTAQSTLALDPTLRSRVAQSLVAHGRHIAANLEGGPALRGNHYLADIVGLAVLGAWVDTPEATEWRTQSRRALEREVVAQVHADGVGFEASLPYHGLALELFLVGLIAVNATGDSLSEGFRERLVRMMTVSRAVRHPDGRIPLFGDQDSGRVLPAGFARPPTHDPIVWLAAAVLGAPRPFDAPPDEEIAWILGVDAWREVASRPLALAPADTVFRRDGLYILRGAGTHMVVRWGDVGQNGYGGHGHNDVSSFELSMGETLVVVDSGTYTYTTDPAQRNGFRAARAHNVMTVDGRDMHPIPTNDLFRLPQHARVKVEQFDEESGAVVLSGRHDGFRRRGDRVVCHRTIRVDRGVGAVDITDLVEGRGERSLESRLHLAPGVRATLTTGDIIDVEAGKRHLLVRFTGADEIVLEPAWTSSEYGARTRTVCIVAIARTRLPGTLRCSIEYSTQTEPSSAHSDLHILDRRST